MTSGCHAGGYIHGFEAVLTGPPFSLSFSVPIPVPFRDHYGLYPVHSVRGCHPHILCILSKVFALVKGGLCPPPRENMDR